jgi:protein O-mannosyl-transferase
MMRRSHAIALVLGVVPLLVFCRVCANQFVQWDDTLLIVGDKHLNPPAVAGLAWLWRHADAEMYIPVIDTAWWGLVRMTTTPDPVLFHGFNLLIHIGSVMLVYRILRRLIVPGWPAAAGALLFAIHPLQVEPAAWATGMKDVLSGFLALAALLNYVRFCGSRSPVSYAAASAFFLLALLAKPSTVTLPLTALALEMLLLTDGGPASCRRAAKWLAPWLAAALVVTIVGARVQPRPDMPYESWAARLLVAGDALAFYLWKLVLPLGLAIDYGRRPLMVLRPYIGWIPLAAVTGLVPVVVASLIIRLGNRRIAAAGLIMFLGLLPVLGLRPFSFQLTSTVADRYMYLSMLGPALALAEVARRSNAGAARLAVAAALAACAGLSFIQAGYWRDTESLYLHDMAVNPASWRAHHNIGIILADRGDVIGAMKEYQKVLELVPDQGPEYRFVADAKAALGDFSEASDYARRLIELQPRLKAAERSNLAELHRWRGGILLRWARSAANDPAVSAAAYRSAADEFEQSLALQPNESSARDDLDAARAALGNPGSQP